MNTDAESECIRSLKIDIDLPYRFVKEHFDYYVEHARYVLRMFSYRDLVVKLKRSPSGNAHVNIVVDRCVDKSIYHVLMWLLGDDHKRLTHSMKRFLITNHIMDFHYNHRWKGKQKEGWSKKP